ncbi:MAG: hypothetical protein ACE5K7_05265 [Phycisphaerae bacterium]
MDLQERLEALLAVAERLGIQVRREPLGGQGGGLCTLRGRKILFVDSEADAETRYETALSALGPLEAVHNHYLRPELREDLERYRPT